MGVKLTPEKGEIGRGEGKSQIMTIRGYNTSNTSKDSKEDSIE
tara:strand:+ start:334 stop:462 length:129 start_codon:yes stop_codon:yes gene_type:complete